MIAPPKTDKDVPSYLTSLFQAAIDAANPASRIAGFLPRPPRGRTVLIAAGKAASSMARAVEEAWPLDSDLSGVALTRYGHGIKCTRVEVIEAAHPVPDNRGHDAAVRMLAQAKTLGPDDLLLFLVSGGGSALLALPAEGISIDEKKQVNRTLLLSGAPIGEMNVVRKHLSAIKGGRLAQAAAPARIATLAISDVPGDDPSTIASGPTVPDPSTVEDALAIIEKYGMAVPETVSTHLHSGKAETPDSTSPVFANSEFHMICTPSDMIKAVHSQAESKDIDVLSLGADIEGEARVVGTRHAEMARQTSKSQRSVLILSGGETTVTVDSGSVSGKGGRNCEYLLALAIELDGAAGIHAVAADTDGIDGSEDNAGAIISPDTLKRARKMGLDAEHMLASHDSYTFFERLGDLIKTGPTRTNVNDFRAIWVTRTEGP